MDALVFSRILFDRKEDENFPSSTNWPALVNEQPDIWQTYTGAASSMAGESCGTINY